MNRRPAALMKLQTEFTQHVNSYLVEEKKAGSEDAETGGRLGRGESVSIEEGQTRSRIDDSMQPYAAL